MRPLWVAVVPRSLGVGGVLGHACPTAGIVAEAPWRLGLCGSREFSAGLREGGGGLLGCWPDLQASEWGWCKGCLFF